MKALSFFTYFIHPCFNRKRFLLIIPVFIVLFPAVLAAQTTIYKETIGSFNGTVNITSYSGWSFPSASYSMPAGTVKVTNSVVASNYSGASGGAPISINPTSTMLVSGINTSGYSNIKLSFGIHKNNKLEDGSELIIEVSTNGTVYTPLSSLLLPTGNGTGNSWFYRTGGLEVTGIIPAASNLRIRFRNTGLATYAIDDLELKSSIALPIRLIDFNVEQTNNRAAISWSTIQEVGMSHFELQRSLNGSSFNTIETIPARNRNNEEKYSATDLISTDGKVYYRLLCVDLDGTITMSRVVSISQKNSGADFSIVNDLSSKSISVVANAHYGNYTYTVFSLAGQVFQQGQISIISGTNRISLQPSVGAGAYLIHLSNGKDNQQFRFAIQ